MGSWRVSRDKNKIKQLETEIEGWDYEKRDIIYRLLWEANVKEDVEAELESYEDEIEGYSDDEYESLVSLVAERFVGGDYDCSAGTYWDNIDSLINAVI